MEGLELLLETLGDGRFVDAVLTDRAGDRRVRIRPVDLARGRMVQFETTVDGATSVANVEPVEMPDRVALLLDDGYRSVFVRLTDRSEQFTVTKRGRLLRTVHAGANTSSDTSHDRQPDRSVPEDAPFLVALGLTDRNGRIKPSSRDKYLQVVRFVDILDTTLDRSLDELSELLLDELGDLLADRLPEHVRFAEREPGELGGDPHHLFLIDDDPVRRLENLF